MCFAWERKNLKFSCPRHKGSWSRCVAILILNLGTRRKWVVAFTSRPLYPLVKHPYPLSKKQDGSRICLGVWRKEYLLSLSEFEPNTVHPVAWSLYRLRYWGLTSREAAGTSSFYSKADSFPFSEETGRLLRNPKVYICVHNSFSSSLFVGKDNPVQGLLDPFVKDSV